MEPVKVPHDRQCPVRQPSLSPLWQQEHMMMPSCENRVKTPETPQAILQKRANPQSRSPVIVWSSDRLNNPYLRHVACCSRCTCSIPIGAAHQLRAQDAQSTRLIVSPRHRTGDAISQTYRPFRAELDRTIVMVLGSTVSQKHLRCTMKSVANREIELFRSDLCPV